MCQSVRVVSELVSVAVMIPGGPRLLRRQDRVRPVGGGVQNMFGNS